MKPNKLSWPILLSLFAIFNPVYGQAFLLSDAEADRIVAEEFAAKEVRKAAQSDFTVLETFAPLKGNKRIVIHKVLAPNLKPVTPIAAIKRNIPDEESALLYSNLYPERRSLSLGVQIYDNKVSELIWRKEERTIRAYSNIDFSYLTPVGEFGVDGIVYSLLAMTTQTTRSQELERLKVMSGWGLDVIGFTVPELSDFNGRDPEYIIFADSNESIPAELLEALDALHLYYLEHETELKNAVLNRNALAEARNRYEQAHPRVEDSAVIHYWVIEGPEQGWEE